MTNEQVKRPKPTSDIDLQAMTTIPHISSEYMSEAFKNKFREFSTVVDDKGKPIKDGDGRTQLQIERDFWASMEIFTQDFRLGNLGKEESEYVRYNIDLGFDILTVLPEEFHKPALLLVERSICVTETSQSKIGFLRKLFNTFFQKSTVKDEGQTKRSFFGFGKKNKSED